SLKSARSNRIVLARSIAGAAAVAKASSTVTLAAVHEPRARNSSRSPAGTAVNTGSDANFFSSRWRKARSVQRSLRSSMSRSAYSITVPQSPADASRLTRFAGQSSVTSPIASRLQFERDVAEIALGRVRFNLEAEIAAHLQHHGVLPQHIAGDLLQPLGP